MIAYCEKFCKKKNIFDDKKIKLNIISCNFVTEYVTILKTSPITEGAVEAVALTGGVEISEKWKVKSEKVSPLDLRKKLMVEQIKIENLEKTNDSRPA